MGLRDTFKAGVEAIFSAFDDAVKSGVYSIITDTGFEETSEEVETVRVILDRFTQKDVETLAFSENIQPTDSKGMIPVVDITGEMNTGNTLTIGDREFTIVDYDVDPIEVLYTLLLRDV